MAIKKCVCEHAFQDEEHGDKLRVANPTKDIGVHRCSVCGKLISPAASSKPGKKKE